MARALEENVTPKDNTVVLPFEVDDDAKKLEQQIEQYVLLFGAIRNAVNKYDILLEQISNLHKRYCCLLNKTRNYCSAEITKMENFQKKFNLLLKKRKPYRTR